SARISVPGAQLSVSLPAGTTSWMTITAIRTRDGSAGGQFGISELTLDGDVKFPKDAMAVVL
uniref:hypothetical protein n=1 Tax=Nocardia cyriacigeorgica TaxID=135487 RepID=UPI0024589FEF